MFETSKICKFCGTEMRPGDTCPTCTENLQKGKPDENQVGMGAYLVRADLSEKFELSQRQCHIGRDATNDIVISNDKAASRFHACVKSENGMYIVEDLKSTNGTLLNGEALHGRRPLVNGDRLLIGRNEFVFVIST